MGTFEYGDTQFRCEIDDRTLLHLQMVIVSKLRRTERFLFQIDSDDALCRDGFWMSPEIPIRFHYNQQQRPDVNPVWLRLLADTASGVAGLRVLPEPEAPTPLRASNGRAKHAALSGARS